MNSALFLRFPANDESRAGHNRAGRAVFKASKLQKEIKKKLKEEAGDVAGLAANSRAGRGQGSGGGGEKGNEDEFSKLSQKQLLEKCSARNLATSGNKQALLARFRSKTPFADEGDKMDGSLMPLASFV